MEDAHHDEQGSPLAGKIAGRGLRRSQTRRAIGPTAPEAAGNRRVPPYGRGELASAFD